MPSRSRPRRRGTASAQTSLETPRMSPHPIADKDVGDVVCRIIAEALGRDVEVRLTSNLMEDLGAESLDFLDIVFTLAHTVGIKSTRGKRERAPRGDMSEEESAPSGVISPAGLARLREL